LVRGENRRRNIQEALADIDEWIKPVLTRKKSVRIKPNFVSTSRQLASSRVDAIQGILDYVAPRFNGSVVVAEASAGDTVEAFESFSYQGLRFDPRSRNGATGRFELGGAVPDRSAAEQRFAAGAGAIGGASDGPGSIRH
jgi:hypothetical protein